MQYKTIIKSLFFDALLTRKLTNCIDYVYSYHNEFIYSKLKQQLINCSKVRCNNNQILNWFSSIYSIYDVAQVLITLDKEKRSAYSQQISASKIKFYDSIRNLADTFYYSRNKFLCIYSSLVNFCFRDYLSARLYQLFHNQFSFLYMIVSYIYMIVSVLQLYKYGYGLIYSMFQSMVTIVIFCLLKYYFSSKQSIFAKPQINIEQEINKIFVIPKIKIEENDQSTSSLDQLSNTYISVKISSNDGSDLSLKRLNNFKNIITLITLMLNGDVQQEKIDYFQITFEEYLGYNQKHYTVIISLIKYFCDYLCLEVNIIVSQNFRLNRQLAGELTQGLYIIGFNLLQKSKSYATHNEALQQITDIILRMEHDLSLSILDRQKLFKDVLDLSPPQFEIIKVSNFLFYNENISLTQISPYITIHYIIEYFSYKFLVSNGEQYENKQNFMEFEQTINEIENRLQILVFNMQTELEQIFIFWHIDLIRKTDETIQSYIGNNQQLDSGRIIINKQFGSFYGGDEIPNEIIQHKIAIQESYFMMMNLLFQLFEKVQYLFYLSSWYEKILQSNQLFKSALVKSRPTCMSYFHISFITITFMPSYYSLLKEFQCEKIQSSFLGIHFALIKVNYICLVMLIFSSFLQIINNVTPAFSHYRLINNVSNLQEDAFKNLLNVNDSKSLEQPQIRLGKKLICFLYEVCSLSALYFLLFSTYSVKILLHAQHKNQKVFFFRIISHIMFMINTTVAISFSVLSQPEELVSLTFFTKLFFILLFVSTGIYFKIADAILFIFMTAIMLVYYIPQLQNFINHGRQQQQNFNLLKMKSKQIQHRIPPFTSLVYNILASKYVSLITVIQSNYILRRAKIINQNEEEFNTSNNFLDKLCQYSNLLQDKKKRQNSCIIYPQIIFSIFSKPQNWNSDDQLDFNDLIAEMPQIYQIPIDCPNAVYFVESENHQHCHNAIQIVLAFSQGVMKKLKIESCAVTSGSLVIYVLEAGQIHTRSQCIQDAKELLKLYSGLIVDGLLFSVYKNLDEKFKLELLNRINLSTDKEEISKLKSLVMKLSSINYDNGKAVAIEIIK